MKIIKITDDIYDSLNGLNIPFTEVVNENSMAIPKKTKLEYAAEIPVGTLVKVWDDIATTFLGYFAKALPDEFCVYDDGSSPRTNGTGLTGWESLSIAQGDWVFWQGGECPVPEWMQIEVHISRGGSTKVTHPKSYNWKWDNSDGDIIAYRIMGQELPNE